MMIDSLKSVVGLTLLLDAPAFAISSVRESKAILTAPKVSMVDSRGLPKYGTTVDADGKILAFSMPDVIEVEHALDGARMKVRPVRSAAGNGMSMEIVGPVPPAATGVYSGILRVSFDYN